MRKKVEKNNDLTIESWYNDKAIGIARKLALNETNGKIILDKIWEKYGSFQSFNLHPAGWDYFLEKIEKEVESLNEPRLPFNSSVEKYIRSLYGLWYVPTFPTLWETILKFKKRLVIHFDFCLL